MEGRDPRDERIAELTALLAAALGRISVLEARVAELEAQLRTNSSNSSKPPSSDGPGVPPVNVKKLPSGRKRGGQPGHRGHQRKLVNNPDEVTRLIPSQCAGCQHSLEGEDPNPRRHQVWEVLPLRARVSEFQQHTLSCANCGECTQAPLPPGVPLDTMGPRLKAIITTVRAKFRLSTRLTCALLSDLFQVPLCPASVVAAQKAVSAALAAPVNEAVAHVRLQSSANADETSWRQGAQKAWLWTVGVLNVTVFIVALSRGGKVAKELMEGFKGILCSDRYCGYLWLPPERRQVCWAHLKRDFQALVDRGGVGNVLGLALLEQSQLMFEQWHRFKAGIINRKTLTTRTTAIKSRVLSLLLKGTHCGQKQTEGTCKELVRIFPALWTFASHTGVEPTNNRSEQDLRTGVIWRKLSFGSQSAEGSAFVARMLTTVVTLRHQQGNVVDFVTEACRAHLSGQSAPSLLPRSATQEA